MRFLIDAQLPRQLATWLSAAGYECDHMGSRVPGSANDQAIWDLALSRQAIVITNDRDFVEWANARRPTPQIIWIRIGNATNAVLTRRLEAVWGRVAADLSAGVAVVEVSSS